MSDASRQKGGRRIFRRVETGAEGEPEGKRRVRYERAPALVPLAVGFVLLLSLIFYLGDSAARRLDRVSDEVFQLQRQRGTQLRLLLDLRAALTEIDGEARLRAERRAAGGLLPPFALRLRTARARAEDAARRFRDIPLIAPAEREEFVRDFDEFLRVTEAPERYNIEGFERFKSLAERLDRFRDEALAAQEAVGRRTDELQKAARGRIRTTMLFALAAGFAVAVGTIWEVQRRFRQVRMSLDEARREREFSAQVLEAMPSAVATFDASRTLRGANQAFLRIFPQAEISAALSPDSAASEAMLMLESVMAEDAGAAAGYRGRWRLDTDTDGDSAMKTFDAYVAPVKLGDEDGLILTLVDATEAAAAEIALRRQASLAAVGQAAAQVAHEIKNPLGSIRLGVSLLRDMTQDAEMLSTLDLIERGIAHLNKLTVDVTQFARERPLELAQVDLHELLDASLDLVRDKIAEKHTLVERRYAAEPLRGELDADQLRQVFVNLFANAVEASAAGAPVSVATDVRNGDAGRRLARIRIADSGEGMTEETRARLFEPFFTTKKRGTGLGLAVSKKIVEQHGGRIEVASVPGRGTEFIIELPL